MVNKMHLSLKGQSYHALVLRAKRKAKKLVDLGQG